MGSIAQFDETLHLWAWWARFGCQWGLATSRVFRRSHRALWTAMQWPPACHSMFNKNVCGHNKSHSVPRCAHTRFLANITAHTFRLLLHPPPYPHQREVPANGYRAQYGACFPSCIAFTIPLHAFVQPNFHRSASTPLTPAPLVAHHTPMNNPRLRPVQGRRCGPPHQHRRGGWGSEDLLRSGCKGGQGTQSALLPQV